MDISPLLTQYYPEAVSLRRRLHQNPELSGQEFASSALIRETLQMHGIAIEPLECKTGVCAFLPGKAGGETVVLREDIDALPMQEETGLSFASQIPGVCHSCGHDLHTACLLLAGIVLNQCREQLPCDVRLVFQPAEETMSGAEAMLASGLDRLEPKGDLILGVHTSPDHPAGSIALIQGPANASSDQLSITIRGKGGHGAHPDRTVDPIVTAGMLLTQLQTIVSRENMPFDPAVLSFGTIHGGTAPNIIPDEVTLTGTLRTFDEAVRQAMLDSVRRIAEGCCQAMRAQAEVKVVRGIPVLVNDPGIAGQIEAAARKTIGAEHVRHLERPSSGSDDFSVFLQRMPGVQFLIGTANNNPNSRLGLHNPKTQFDEAAIYTGAHVMCQFVLDRS